MKYNVKISSKMKMYISAAVIIGLGAYGILYNVFKPVKLIEDNYTLYGNDLHQIGGSYSLDGRNIIIGDPITENPGFVIFKFDLGPSNVDFDNQYIELRIMWQGQEGKGLHSSLYGKKGKICLNDEYCIELECNIYVLNTYYYISSTESEILINNLPMSLLTSRYQFVNLSVEENVFWDINKISFVIGKAQSRNLFYEFTIIFIGIISLTDLLLNIFNYLKEYTKKVKEKKRV